MIMMTRRLGAALAACAVAGAVTAAALIAGPADAGITPAPGPTYPTSGVPTQSTSAPPSWGGPSNMVTTRPPAPPTVSPRPHVSGGCG